MYKCFLKLLVIICFAASSYGCSDKNNKSFSITFSADSSTIVFNHIDPTGLLALKNSKPGDSVFNDLISVLHTPSENDSLSREEPVEGKILITDSNLVFVPLRPFVKGRDYLVITHLDSRFGDAAQLVKGKSNYGVEPRQKTLSR